MSILTSFLKWFFAYILAGILSYYISMFFFYLARLFAIPLSVFSWISSHILPVSDYVIVVWYSLVFIMLFKIGQTLYLKISN